MAICPPRWCTNASAASLIPLDVRSARSTRNRPASRALAARVEVPDGARIFGTAQRSLPELATFANGVMVRYLDGNDVFPAGGGHPSDVIPAVLAAVDVAGADGPAAITAIVLAYEIYGGLFRAARMRDRG